MGVTYSISMEKLSNLITKTAKRKNAPHALSAASDLIEEAGLFSKAYGRGYWLRRLSAYQKRHGIDAATVFNRITGLLNEARRMDPKYSKGGWLTNKLKL